MNFLGKSRRTSLNYYSKYDECNELWKKPNSKKVQRNLRVFLILKHFHFSRKQVTFLVSYALRTNLACNNTGENVEKISKSGEMQRSLEFLFT